MARIVCVTSGLRGLTNASFELAARLGADGHDVVCASPADIAAEVGSQGLRFRALPSVNLAPAPEAPKASGALAGPRSRLLEWLSAPARRRQGVEALGMQAFRDFLGESRADLYLFDAELYEHVFTAHSEGVNFALLTPFFANTRDTGLPPLQSAMSPNDGPLRIDLAWRRLRLERRLDVLKTRLRYAFTDRRSVLRRYARQAGFPLRQLRQYDWVTLFTFHGLPVLNLTARELDFPHEPPPGVHYVGPMVAEDRRDAFATAADRARLEALLERRSQGDLRLVYCGVTTMGDADVAFLERVIEAAGRREDWLLVIALGAPPDDLPPMPDNVHVFERVPQVEVLRNADCCITHGGVNTVNECLVYEVPMIVYSGRRFDQDGVAARVAFHGLGVSGDRRSDDATMIERRIATVMANERLGANLANMRRQVMRYREERVLEETVAGLLAE